MYRYRKDNANAKTLTCENYEVKDQSQSDNLKSSIIYILASRNESMKWMKMDFKKLTTTVPEWSLWESFETYGTVIVSEIFYIMAILWLIKH